MLTYRRPDCLARIVPLLAAQAARQVPSALVVVIDNDPDGGAAEIVGHWNPNTVRYVHEPRPGIAAARNRALDEAGDSEALVFIDDDELPGDGWLTTIVAAWRTWGCAAVAGPVVAQFDQPVDPWIAASGAFDRRVHRTGDEVPGAATHNLLLDLGAVREYGLRFDERLGLTGGEDTMFSHQLVHRGGVIRWCDEAEVVEPIAPERLNRRWVLRRAYRAGSSWSLMELALADSSAARIRRRLHLASRGILKLAWGVAMMVVGVLTRDVSRKSRGAVVSASYAGLLGGTFGFSLREYARS